jgi:hypothetical protein
MTPWNPAEPVEYERAPDAVDAVDRISAERRGCERPGATGGDP